MKRQVRVFLSSPGDVTAERKFAIDAIKRLGRDAELKDRVTLHPIAWETGTPLLATMTPQEAINQGLPKPSECDIVLVIFWSRMGTPLPHPEYRRESGEPYFSGTDWEYDDALTAAKQNGKPLVVVYRRTEKVALEVDDPQFEERRDQYEKVKRFFANFHDADSGAIRQGYNNYATLSEFQEQLESHLKDLVLRVLGEQPRGKQSLSDEPSLELLLEIDAEYRHKAETDELEKLKPKMFNPERKAWLPVLKTLREGWSFVVMFSNTSRAHQAGKTRDWVVIYFRRGGGKEMKYTVVTEIKGPMKDKRVIRGREDETRRYYETLGQ